MKLGIITLAAAVTLVACPSPNIPDDAALDEARVAREVADACANLRSHACPAGRQPQCEAGLGAAARNGIRIDLVCVATVVGCDTKTCAR